MAFASITEAEARFAHQDHYAGPFEITHVKRSGLWDFPPFSFVYGISDIGGWDSLVSTEGVRPMTATFSGAIRFIKLGILFAPTHYGRRASGGAAMAPVVDAVTAFPTFGTTAAILARIIVSASLALVFSPSFARAQTGSGIYVGERMRGAPVQEKGEYILVTGGNPNADMRRLISWVQATFQSFPKSQWPTYYNRVIINSVNYALPDEAYADFLQQMKAISDRADAEQKAEKEREKNTQASNEPREIRMYLQGTVLARMLTAIKLMSHCGMHSNTVNHYRGRMSAVSSIMHDKGGLSEEDFNRVRELADEQSTNDTAAAVARPGVCGAIGDYKQRTDFLIQDMYVKYSTYDQYMKDFTAR